MKNEMDIFKLKQTENINLIVVACTYLILSNGTYSDSIHYVYTIPRTTNSKSDETSRVFIFYLKEKSTV